MRNKMEEKAYKIRFHEVDCLNRLKETVLLNFLQDIASIDAETIGVGYSKIKDKNIGWFLTKYYINIFKPFNNTKEIKIVSLSKGAIKINCFRDFDIYNSSNEKIGEATSCWILNNLETGKIIPPANLFHAFEIPNKTQLRSTFPKIPAIQKIDFQGEHTALFSELDVNKHVNNSTYLTWANDILPIEILTKTRIAQLEIQYKKQVKYGEKIIIFAEYDKENEIITHELKSESGDTVCMLRQKRVKI